MKYPVGTIVFAKLSGHKVWWPGQIASPAEGGDEAYCKQLPGHSLVCLYGNNKWSWLPAPRVVEFESHMVEYSKAKCSKVWQLALEEAKEALDRSKGRLISARHNPPVQLQARHGLAPAAGAEVLFGYQQHPRAQPLMLALQKGAHNNNVHNGPAGNGAAASRSSARAAEAAGAACNGDPSSLGRQSSSGAGTSSGGTPRASRDNSSFKGGYSIPAWPEYLHEASASVSDVHTVSASDALAWLRATARGSSLAQPLMPEQELSARQQLMSLDLARRQTALAAMVQAAAGTSHTADINLTPSSPRQPSRRNNKPGLQPGTHSLSLPEEVARSLAPIMQLLQQDPLLLTPAPPAKPTPAAVDARNGSDGGQVRRAAGGGSVVGVVAADLVLRVNGQVLPFTCAVTVQLVNSALLSPAASAPASPTAAAPSQGAVVMQYRVGGLHTVLQQLMPMAVITATGDKAAGGGDAVGSALVKQERGPGGSEGKGAEKEKHLVPGPVVEGWQALGPHQLMLSLAVPAPLLQLVAPVRPAVLNSGRISNSGSELLVTSTSPVMGGAAVQTLTAPVPQVARSPTAALLATYGVILPASSGGKRTSPRDGSGAGVLKRLASDGLQGDGAPGSMSTIGLHRPGAAQLKRMRVPSDGGPDPSQPGSARAAQAPSPSPALAAIGRHRSASNSGQQPPLSPPAPPAPPPPPKRPAWSSRVTPYDPAEPFTHPQLQNGSYKPPAPLRPQPSMNPISPTAEGAAAASHLHRQLARNTSGRETDGNGNGQHGLGSMGPPQPRLQSQPSLNRRSTDCLYLGSLQPIQTNGGRHDSGAQQWHGGKDGSPLAEEAAGNGGTCSARLAAALHVLQPNNGNGGGGGGKGHGEGQENRANNKQKGVLLVEVRVGNLSKFDASRARKRAPEGPPALQVGPQWKHAKIDRGLAHLLQQLTSKGTITLGPTGLAPCDRNASASRGGDRSGAGLSNARQRQPSQLLPLPVLSPQLSQGVQHADEIGNGTGRATALRSPSLLPDAPAAAQHTNPTLPFHMVPPAEPAAAFRRPSWLPSPPLGPALHANHAASPEPSEGTTPLPLAAILSRASRPLSGNGIGGAQHLLQGDGLGGEGRGGAEIVAVAALPTPSAPTTPQLDSPYVRSQTPEGQHLQTIAAQLAGAAGAVRGTSAAKHQPSGPLNTGAMEVLATLRDKAAVVATRAMVVCLSPAALTSAESQLRSEPLQHLLCAARETLAACDAAAASHIANHTATLRPAAAAAAAASSTPQQPTAAVSGGVAAYADVAAAASVMLLLLGGSGDEEEESSESEEEEGGKAGGSGAKREPRRLGLLGGLEEQEIEALQKLAQPLAAAAPAAAAALRALSCTPATLSLPAPLPQARGAAAPATAGQQAAGSNAAGRQEPQPPASGSAHDAHVTVSTHGAADMVCVTAGQTEASPTAQQPPRCLMSPA